MENNIQSHEEQLLPELSTNFTYFPFRSKNIAILLLLLIGFAYYWNTVNNETVFDDGINIHQNSYVLKGVSGFGDILSSDAYASFYKKMNASDQLEGGRYRPLSILTFALEQEIIGTYRTGYYMWVQDLNKNGVIDNNAVDFTNSNGKPDRNYEYNDFVDVNKDGVVQADECYSCWDQNKNFRNDLNEDLNQDGIFNEVDCQVSKMGFRHFNNVWMYLLAIILLYLVFSNYVFRSNQDMAFLATLLFLIHPLNTETVAVVCRRDEILSLLFTAFTFLFSFKYFESKKTKHAVLAAIGLFLAMLSKEYGIMLLVLIPIGTYTLFGKSISFKGILWPTLTFIGFSFMLYAVKKIDPNSLQLSFLSLGLLIVISFILIMFLFYRKNQETKGITFLLLFLFSSFMLYLLARFNAVNVGRTVIDTEILNNPYAFATGEEQFATKATILLYYLKLLFYPAVLVCDYSYSSIPYKHFSDWEFIASLIVNLGLLFLGIKLVLKQHVLGFAISCYLAFLLIVGNVIYNISATMNEHLIFHSTIGFVIAISWLVITAMNKLKLGPMVSKLTINLALLILVIVFGYKVIERNKDWSNDVTLFLKDAEKAPNSVIVLGNAGARWIDLADTREITGISLPGQDTTVFNDYNGTLHISDEEVRDGGYKTKREAALNKGINYLKHAVELHPNYVNGYLNLGLAFYKLDEHDRAVFYWKMAEAIYPSNPYLMNYYEVAGNTYKEKGDTYFEAKEYSNAIKAYTRCVVIDRNKTDALNGIGACYFNMQEGGKAEAFFLKVLAIDPNNTNAKIALDNLKKLSPL